MIIVYGADWCEDTRRALRHLRRLGVPHHFQNVDEDLDALARATALNGGVRRTPTIDLGFGGEPLVEPSNDAITGALVEIEMLTHGDAAERLGVQNVGDLERIGRTVGGLDPAGRGKRRATRAALAAAAARRRRRPDRRHRLVPGLPLERRLVARWSGDRPAEATRATWLSARPLSPSRTNRTATRRRCWHRVRLMSPTTVSALDRLAAARHANPFAVLGPHLEPGRLVVRAFLPGAESIAVLRDGTRPSRRHACIRPASSRPRWTTSRPSWRIASR